SFVLGPRAEVTHFVHWVARKDCALYLFHFGAQWRARRIPNAESPKSRSDVEATAGDHDKPMRERALTAAPRRSPIRSEGLARGHAQAACDPVDESRTRAPAREATPFGWVPGNRVRVRFWLASVASNASACLDLQSRTYWSLSSA